MSTQATGCASHSLETSSAFLAFQKQNPYIFRAILGLMNIQGGVTMKRLSPISVALLATIYLSLTGFQCGSAESTSAKLYMQQKQYDKAEDALQKEVAKNPNDEEAWFMLGQVRIELKKYLEANQAYDKALSISDAHKKEIANNKMFYWGQFLNSGVEAYNNGRTTPESYDTAIVKFQSAIQFEPDSATTYHYLALAQLAKGEDDKAIESLQQAIKRKPGYADALKILAGIYLSRANGRLDAKDQAGAKANLQKAADLYETARKTYPDRVEYISQLIDIYQKLDQEDKSLALTRDALAKDPNNRAFIYVYGEFLLKQSKFEQSIEQLKKVAEKKPDSVDVIYTNANYNLGVAYQNWGVALKEQAEKKAEEEQKSGKKPKNAQEDQSYKDKFNLARVYFEKTAELKPDDPVVWQQLGKLYAVLNMADKAKAAFKKFDELNK